MSRRRSTPPLSAEEQTVASPSSSAPLTAETLTQFSQRIAEFGGGLEPRWFRGVDDASYQLIPSLYRHNPTSAFSEC